MHKDPDARLQLSYKSCRLCPLSLGAGACAVARQLQEQQLKARQLVLQQQAASATAAASKTQREVRPGSALQSCSGIACTLGAPAPSASATGSLP